MKIFTELHRVFDKSFGAVNFFDIFLVAAREINVFESENDLILFYDCIQTTHGWNFILGTNRAFGIHVLYLKSFLVEHSRNIGFKSDHSCGPFTVILKTSFKIHPFKANQSVIHKASVGAHFIWIVRSYDFHFQIFDFVVFIASIGDKYTPHGNCCASIFNHFWSSLESIKNIAGFTRIAIVKF